MEPLLEFGLEATRWLQNTYPQLEEFFQIVSLFGIEEFYLALLPLIYWCLNKQLGKHYAYVFVVAVILSPLLKHAFRDPRPYWLDSQLGLSVETSYGIPSGHALLGATTYFFLAGWIRRRWAWVLALLLAIIMGLSRIYLGVHFVHDVIAGFLVAMLLLIIYFVWQRTLAARFSKRILGFRLMVAIAIPLILLLVYVLILFLIGQPDTTVPWAEFIPAAELSAIEGVVMGVSTLLGVGIGLIFEASRIRFLVAGPVWKRALRYIIGLVVMLAIWAGLRSVFPTDPLWLALPFRTLRYLLLALWVTYYAPLLFVRLRLAGAEPDPGINLTL